MTNQQKLKLVNKWRREANSNMSRIRKVNYTDQCHRTQLYVIAQTLRSCAKALNRTKPVKGRKS